MRKTLLFTMALACASLLGTAARSVEMNTATAPSAAPPMHDVKWVGVAVSRTGRPFQDPGDYEKTARLAAINDCETTTGVSCETAISVPDSWDVTVLRCGNSFYLGGSGQGVADDIAYNKAFAEGHPAYSCSKIANY